VHREESRAGHPGGLTIGMVRGSPRHGLRRVGTRSPPPPNPVHSSLRSGSARVRRNDRSSPVGTGDQVKWNLHLSPRARGHTKSRRCSRNADAVHPRVRGDHVGPEPGEPHRAGSSPRARGPLLVSSSDPSRGSIHPRARGDHDCSDQFVRERDLDAVEGGVNGLPKIVMRVDAGELGGVEQAIE
jgi:hypothetical protein